MNSSNKYDVIIIGAGLAGISCAIRLRMKGNTVLVIEKNESYGGKIAETKWNGYRWDKGPSLFTEPELIEELFELSNKKISDYFEYDKQDRSCSYYFPDYTSATFFKEPKKLNQELDKIGNVTDREAFYKYVDASKKLYNLVGDFFISNPIPGIKDVLRPSMLKLYPTLMKRQLRKSLHNHNSKRFKNEKMIQVFDRFGTYNGSNAYEMSGLYSMVSHLELEEGTFAPKKGMRSIVDSLYQLSIDIGVEYTFNQNVQVNLDKDVYYVEGSTEYRSDALVCAIDHIEFYTNVFKNETLEKKYKKRGRSTSGLVFYWAVNTTIPQLGLHNLFFSKDYQKETLTLWSKKELSSDPTIYINISSKVSPDDAPENCENWFVMINTPAGVESSQEYRGLVKQLTIDKIKSTFDIDITNEILHEEYWDSLSIESETGSYQGAIYGENSNRLLSAIKRHKNKSSRYKNLYFCGGTVHPGGGIPLVLRSAKIVDQYF